MGALAYEPESCELRSAPSAPLKRINLKNGFADYVNAPKASRQAAMQRFVRALLSSFR